MENNVILSVRDLDVKFTLRGQTLHAVRGASLDVYEGESLAIVGESGSGKSVFVKTFMGLLDANGFIAGGQIIYNGQDLSTSRTDKDWLKIRGREIAMVLQDPMTSLNPLKTIGKQIEEAVKLHQGLRGAEARRAVLEVLKDVGIDEPERRYRQYPHEFSGGMRQRVVIAIAVACRPKILICDEPTTALDVTIQAQILELIKEMQKKYHLTTIYITHDLSTAYYVSDYIATLYRGGLIEYGPAKEIMDNPAHPYTELLMNAVPRVGDKWTQEMVMPDMEDKEYAITYCKFAPRCKYCTKRCLEEEPELVQVSENQEIRCFYPEKENRHE